MNKFTLLAIFIAFQISLVHSINWENGNWAYKCNFNGNDIGKTVGPHEECAGNCKAKSGCTHFVHYWEGEEGGTCYMKKGSVSKKDAIDTGDARRICGIIKGIVINHNIPLI